MIWNEANSPDYWPRSAGAASYEALLARCYDVLHASRPTVNIKTIGEGDYQTVDALTAAFGGTARPVPSPFSPSIWYLEDGFQTSVPGYLARLYTGRENDPGVIPALGDGPSQASELTAAISLAYCQPAVGAFFNFELIDERRLVGWQSGLMYASGVWKPSLYAYQQVAAAVASHSIDCAKVEGAPPQPAGAP